jgi:hypothetical protein
MIIQKENPNTKKIQKNNTIIFSKNFQTSRRKIKKTNGLKINSENKKKFKQFLQERDQNSSKSNTFTYKFTLNFSKNPLDCIKIFKTLIKEKQHKMRHEVDNLNVQSIEPNQNFEIDHNLQILKFQKNQKKTHPFYRQNYGIELNRPEFIRFDNFTRRLKSEIMMDDKNVNISIGNKPTVENPPGIQLLGKRSFNDVLPIRNGIILSPENNSNSHNSFFRSDQFIPESNNSIDLKFLVKSLDDMNKFPEIFNCIYFHSTYNKHMSSLSEFEEERSERSESSDFMVNILEQIGMLVNTKQCDQSFRESIRKMMRMYFNRTQQTAFMEG